MNYSVINIDTAEIILQNYEINQGKIIITSPYNGNYSFYWGSMGGTLQEFIKSIDSDYFAGKLCPDNYIFSGKETAKAIRRYIKENISNDLPWWRYMPAQKELRESIKDIENCEDQHSALYKIERFKDIYAIGMSFQEDEEFKDIMEDHFNCESWNFLQTELSPSYKFLVKLHKQLKKQL